MLSFCSLGSICVFPTLNSEIIVKPIKAAYQIGDSISLSCPVASVLVGEVSGIKCTPSLQWSPSPEGIHCKTGTFLLENHIILYMFKGQKVMVPKYCGW